MKMRKFQKISEKRVTTSKKGPKLHTTYFYEKNCFFREFDSSLTSDRMFIMGATLCSLENVGRNVTPAQTDFLVTWLAFWKLFQLGWGDGMGNHRQWHTNSSSFLDSPHPAESWFFRMKLFFLSLHFHYNYIFLGNGISCTCLLSKKENSM